jgi:phage anti-repressor protein
MSEVTATLTPMKEIETQIRIARKALALAQEFEEMNAYDAMFSMERTYAEGFLEALEFIYILQNGHEYNGND